MVAVTLLLLPSNRSLTRKLAYLKRHIFFCVFKPVLCLLPISVRCR